MKIKLEFINWVFYIKLNFFWKNDLFLIDTWFSSWLSLKNEYKNKFW